MPCVPAALLQDPARLLRFIDELIARLEQLDSLRNPEIFRAESFDQPAVQRMVHAVDSGAAATELCAASSSAADWSQMLLVWHQSIPAGGKLLTPDDASHKLWFRCECMRLAEIDQPGGR